MVDPLSLEQCVRWVCLYSATNNYVECETGDCCQVWMCMLFCAKNCTNKEILHQQKVFTPRRLQVWFIMPWRKTLKMLYCWRFRRLFSCSIILLLIKLLVSLLSMKRHIHNYGLPNLKQYPIQFFNVSNKQYQCNIKSHSTGYAVK